MGKIIVEKEEVFGSPTLGDHSVARMGDGTITGAIIAQEAEIRNVSRRLDNTAQGLYQAEVDIKGINNSLFGVNQEIDELQNTSATKEELANKKMLHSGLNMVRLYIDASYGDDSASGSAAYPLKTLGKALDAIDASDTDVRVYIVAAGNYTINRERLNGVTIHITSTVPGVNLRFTGRSCAIYNSHINIQGMADGTGNIGIYHDATMNCIYGENTACWFDYVDFHCTFRTTYGGTAHYSNCGFFDDAYSADYPDAVIHASNSSVDFQNTITINFSRDIGLVYGYKNATIKMAGAITENGSYYGKTDNSFMVRVDSGIVYLANTPATKTAGGAHFYRNLIADCALVIANTKARHDAYNTRCVSGSYKCSAVVMCDAVSVFVPA